MTLGILSMSLQTSQKTDPQISTAARVDRIAVRGAAPNRRCGGKPPQNGLDPRSQLQQLRFLWRGSSCV